MWVHNSHQSIFVRFGEPIMCSSGTLMVAPEAYKPWVGGFSNRCGTKGVKPQRMWKSQKDHTQGRGQNREGLAPQSGQKPIGASCVLTKQFSESFYTTLMENKKKSSKQLISFFFSHKKFIKIFPKPIPHNKMNYKT